MFCKYDITNRYIFSNATVAGNGHDSSWISYTGRSKFQIGFLGEIVRLATYRGRGFGHGVGMSQWGAQGMAAAGASAEQILTHYYRGIALTDVGGD